MDPTEPKLQAVVRHLLSMLGVKLGFSVRTVPAFHFGAISPAPSFMFQSLSLSLSMCAHTHMCGGKRAASVLVYPSCLVADRIHPAVCDVHWDTRLAHELPETQSQPPVPP